MQWHCLLFLFLTGNTLFRQIWSKKSPNFQFKLKFGTLNDSNMQNSMVVLTFFCLILETPFLVNEGEQSAIIVFATLQE